MKAFHLKTVLAMTMAVFTLSCAGGLKGSKEEKMAYFDRLEKDTLALLIKERPESEQELAEAAGYTIAEKKTVKVPFVGVGDGTAWLRGLWTESTAGFPWGNRHPYDDANNKTRHHFTTDGAGGVQP